MRIVIFFDLPTLTKKDLKEYRHFVKAIKKEGFGMYQESVYTKLCLNETVVASTLKTIKTNLPKDGFVSSLTLTEKQFSDILSLVGEAKTDVIMTDDRVLKL